MAEAESLEDLLDHCNTAIEQNPSAKTDHVVLTATIAAVVAAEVPVHWQIGASYWLIYAQSEDPARFPKATPPFKVGFLVDTIVLYFERRLLSINAV